MALPSCAIGLMAHDEAGTVGAALGGLVRQEVVSADVRVIAVVSSGSRDGTDAIVRSALGNDPRLKLVVQAARLGKISAVNLFLETFPGMDLYVITNADVVLDPGALERLLGPFHDPAVGMTGGRIVPGTIAGGGRGFMAFANHVLWALHHEIALRRPKLGETIAFRPVVTRIPPEAVADEAYLEAMMHARGYRLVYVPQATIRNGCPATLGEFVAVRRRNAAAHWMLRKRQRYRVSTWGAGGLLAALAAGCVAHARWAYGGARAASPGVQVCRDVRDVGRLGALVFIEAIARGLGVLDGLLAPGRHVRWRMARSARAVAGAEGVRAGAGRARGTRLA